jgi:hypothetical protein
VTNLKILVFSDSHRSRVDMIHAIEEQHPDMIIHLGDLLRDAEDLGFAYPTLPLVSVPGNCDGWTMEPLIRQFQVEGKTILLSHGHLWHVKQGYDLAIAEARKAGADILLFGHTHQAYCQQLEDLWVMNPGASRKSYGTILLENGTANCFITRLE